MLTKGSGWTAHAILGSVHEIITKNKNNEKVPSLEEFIVETETPAMQNYNLVFENVVGQDSEPLWSPQKIQDRRKKRNLIGVKTMHNKYNIFLGLVLSMAFCL